MPNLSIDDFAIPAAWVPLDAANLPSAEIVATPSTTTHPFATDPAALSVDVLSGAAGHILQRSIPPVDLSAFDELTLWFRCDTALTGTPLDLFRPRIALGSAALPIGAPGNDWLRYLICEVGGGWSYALLALDDLDPLVRGALDTIEVQIAVTDGAHRLVLDGLAASASAMIADLDAALLARLDGQLVLPGGPVPAAIEPAPPPANQPAIRLIQYETERNERRAHDGLRPTDFTDTGHRLRPAPVPWDIFYRINFIADARAELAAMQDFVVTALGPRDWLPVGNRALRIEQVDQVGPDDALIDTPYLRYRASAWAEAGPPIIVEPVTATQIDMDIPAGAGA